MNAKPSVLLTRPAGQTEALMSQLQALGYAVTSIPTLQIEILNADVWLPAFQDALESDWLIVTSTNAVRAIGRYLSTSLPAMAALGHTTAEALRANGVSAVITPDQDFRSEGLLARPEFQNVSGKRITLIQGEGGRDTLESVLTERGATVNRVAVYRRLCPPSLPADFAIEADIIVSTSVESLRNLFKMVAPSQHATLQSRQFVVLSDRVAEQVALLGVQRPALVAVPSHAGIVDVIEGLKYGYRN